MTAPRESLEPIEGATRPWRRRLGLKDELLLALLPTITVLAVLGFVEAFSRQRLLFASLASSACLIYLDPLHGTNSIRTLVGSHLLALTAGLGAFVLLGHGYPAAAVAMGVTIVGMIIFDLVHPPAVATSLLFALQSGAEATALLFVLALGLIVGLVILQRLSVWLLARVTAGRA